MMKNKVSKAFSTLPFWIPFPFIFLAIDYYLADEQSWVVVPVAVFLGFMSFAYVAIGKVAEIFIGDVVGILISFITTSVLNNSYDESWFAPLTSITYVLLLSAVILVVQLLAIPIVKLCKKIKSKKNGESQGKFKNSKFFLWLNKGTKIQVFIKKLIGVAVLWLSFYLAGYGMGTLLGLTT